MDSQEEHPQLPGLDVPNVDVILDSWEPPSGRIVRVQPDVTAIDQSFDYEVPATWTDDGRAAMLDIGSMVRIAFNGRRTAGWVTDLDVEATPGLEVLPLAKLSGVGPSAEQIELSRWAAWRWAGKVCHFLRVCSPDRMVPSISNLRPVSQPIDCEASGAFDGQVTLVRTMPSDDGFSLALEAASLGNALVIVPTAAHRSRLTTRLRSVGVFTAEYDDQWARSAAGAVTVGTRSAAFAPATDIQSIVVFDEHDSALKEERTPSWHARDVAIERAERLGIPCVLASPCPSLEALSVSDRRLEASSGDQRAGWPLVKVIDLTQQEQPGLLTTEIVEVIRHRRRVACILNRKGRARMLVCSSCGALVACDDCGAALKEGDDGLLVCPRDASTRPKVCSECGARGLKHLRLGISGLAEELAILAKRDVEEVQAESEEREIDRDGLFIGTEAILHRFASADAVIFLDFDQVLAAHRFRAAEDAFASLTGAARLLGQRHGGGLLMIQTHRPSDPVIRAAAQADPASLARHLKGVRQTFEQPPYGHWALISGAGADQFAEKLDTDEYLAVMHRDGRWRVSASERDVLLDRLAQVDRGPDRIRIEIDPLGV